VPIGVQNNTPGAKDPCFDRAAGQADAWTRQWFGELGLHQLMGTVRYPGVA
jgi:hypothetical protein